MDKYIFRKHSKDYKVLFKKERKKLEKALGKSIIIEHIGSTSIHGLGGKGIIDILISGKKSKIKGISRTLQETDYEFRQKASTKYRLFF